MLHKEMVDSTFQKDDRRIDIVVDELRRLRMKWRGYKRRSGLAAISSLWWIPWC